MADRVVLGPCSIKQREVLTDNTTDILLVGGGAGGGKALRHGEKVLTPGGFVNIEDIKVGDSITTPANTTEAVLAVYPQGRVDIYKVTFQDGTSVDTCGDHLWKFHRAGKLGRGSKVASTLEMKRLLETTRQRPIVPLCEPVELKSAGELLLEPYTLGALLGDGCFTHSTPVLTSNDSHVFDKVEADGYALGKVQVKSKTTAIGRGVLGTLSIIRSLGLHGKDSATKFIPDAYKQASIADRWSLVQGMFDTDGYVDAEGSTYYTTVSPVMAVDLEYILRSLGFTVTTTSRIPHCNGKQGQLAYTLYVRGRHQKLLFTLPRKVARTRVKLVGNRVVSVVKVGVDFATCIAISGEDKLFVTTDFIVTHNSFLALLKALKYCDDPAARVLIIRLSYPSLKAVGGLVDESQQLYKQFGADWRVQPLEWRFKNGAIIKFCAMPADLEEVKGWQTTNIIIDEGADFTLEQILAIKNRLRGARYKGKLNMTITCNPDRNSWLYPFVEYCLDDDGVPKAGTEDITRYFIVRAGKVLWGESHDKLYEEHGRGLNRDEANGPVTFKPTSFRFIPMDVYSNPVLLKNNPDYLQNLLSGTRVDQLRFLHGSWTALPEGSSTFSRSWVKIVPHPPANPQQRVRSWDLAHSKPSETYPDPDYTAGVLMSRTRGGGYCIEHVTRFRELPNTVVQNIIDIATDTDGLETPVTIPKDNGSGKTTFMFLMREFAEAGMTASGILISGHVGKMKRFLPFCTIAQAGLVTMVEGPWNEEFLTELEYFTGGRNEKNDQVDACSDAFNKLARATTIPTFALPNMSQPDPTPRLTDSR